MHELSIAHEVCRIAEAHLGMGEAHRLRVLTVEVGADSGLEPANLEFCLEALLLQPPFGQARPRILSAGGDALRIESLDVEDGGAP